MHRAEDDIYRNINPGDKDNKDIVYWDIKGYFVVRYIRGDKNGNYLL
jgi:hypothetical protein